MKEELSEDDVREMPCVNRLEWRCIECESPQVGREIVVPLNDTPLGFSIDGETHCINCGPTEVERVAVVSKKEAT